MPIFIHFYYFDAFSYFTVGVFLAIFPIFLGFVGIFWGTPAIYFADLGAILAIFDHFWAIFEGAPLGAVGPTAPEPPAEFGARPTKQAAGLNTRAISTFPRISKSGPKWV